ncbi:MAG TPA: c-type cytochrome [Thermoanaerobaculia bacterium]|nr:c-type cytochrome [Thermoanaerobaculia bacterium]
MNYRKIETVYISAAVAFLLIVLASGCDERSASANTVRPELPEATAQLLKTRAERGKYLVTIMGCNDCHTPLKMGANGPEPDMARMLSGHPAAIGKVPAPKLGEGPWIWAGVGTNTAFHGPWGTSYAANLTPERNTGLGIWDEALFIKAIRTGKHWGTSRPIQPPMPWPFFRQATDEDLKSIFAYLRTLEPIENQVPDYEPPAAPKKS